MKKATAKKTRTFKVAIDGDVFLMLRKISKMSKVPAWKVVDVLLATAFAKGEINEEFPEE